jgi:DME family drug/metabolite transporter
MTHRANRTPYAATLHPGLAFMVLAAALWATVGVADAAWSGATPLSPQVTGLARTALGAGVLVLAARLQRPGRGTHLRIPLLAALAFGLCCALFQVSLFAAFRHESTGIAVTVTVTVCLPPLLMALGEALAARRLPCRSLLVGLALAASGVLLLQLRGSPAMGSPDAAGVLLLLLASLAFCGLTMASRRLLRDMSPVTASATGLAATALVLLSGVLVTEPQGLWSLAALPGRDLALLAYIGLAATGGAYLAFTAGLARLPSAAVGLAATMIEPVFAACLAALFLGDRLSGTQIGGISLLLMALVTLSAPSAVLLTPRPAKTRDRQKNRLH